MKSLKIYSILGISIFLMSCNQQDIEDYNSENIVIVDAEIDRSYTTRVARLGADNLSQFGIFAYDKNIARARNIVYSKKNSAWKSDKSFTWGSGAMDFYGLSPSFAISTSNMNLSMNKTPKFIDYIVPTNYDNQFDIMYSSILQVTQKSSGGKVKFAFKPAMHYLGFVGKNSIGTDYKVIIKSIILHNIVSNGKLVYSTTTSNMADWQVATGTEAIYVNDTIDLTTPIALTNLNQQLLKNEYLVMIPQICTKWNTSEASPIPITTADANHNYYIETVAQIIKDESGNQTYLLGYPDAEVDADHPKYESVYFPVTGKTFKIGLGSTLPIMFNGGYNKDGQLYLEHLDRGEGVEVTVSEWMDFVITPEDWVPVYEELEF